MTRPQVRLWLIVALVLEALLVLAYSGPGLSAWWAWLPEWMHLMLIFSGVAVFVAIAAGCFSRDNHAALLADEARRAAAIAAGRLFDEASDPRILELLDTALRNAEIARQETPEKGKGED